jgi:hypothetical protein
VCRLMAASGLVNITLPQSARQPSHQQASTNKLHSAGRYIAPPRIGSATPKLAYACGKLSCISRAGDGSPFRNAENLYSVPIGREEVSDRQSSNGRFT